MTTDIEPTTGLRGLGVRLPEIGRLRYGVQVPVVDKSTGKQATDKHGRPKTYPKMLETWRLTTTYREAAEAAAEVWGGEVAEWDGGRGQQWEVITTTARLPVVVPRGRVISQAYEQWDAAEQLRSCNGTWDSRSGEACDCPFDPVTDELSDDAKCEPATHLTVLLPGLPGFGSWRLVSHGRNAARKLAGVALLMRTYGVDRSNTSATLVLVQQSAKINGQTRRWAEPMLVPNGSIGEAAELQRRAEAAGELLAGDGEDVAAAPATDGNGDTALTRAVRAELTSTQDPEAAASPSPAAASGDTPAAAEANGGATPPPGDDVPEWYQLSVDELNITDAQAHAVLQRKFKFLRVTDWMAHLADIAPADVPAARQALYDRYTVPEGE